MHLLSKRWTLSDGLFLRIVLETNHVMSVHQEAYEEVGNRGGVIPWYQTNVIWFSSEDGRKGFEY